MAIETQQEINERLEQVKEAVKTKREILYTDGVLNIHPSEDYDYRTASGKIPVFTQEEFKKLAWADNIIRSSIRKDLGKPTAKERLATVDIAKEMAFITFNNKVSGRLMSIVLNPTYPEKWWQVMDDEEGQEVAQTCVTHISHLLNQVLAPILKDEGYLIQSHRRNDQRSTLLEAVSDIMHEVFGYSYNNTFKTRVNTFVKECHMGMLLFQLLSYNNVAIKGIVETFNKFTQQEYGQSYNTFIARNYGTYNPRFGDAFFSVNNTIPKSSSTEKGATEAESIFFNSKLFIAKNTYAQIKNFIEKNYAEPSLYSGLLRSLRQNDVPDMFFTTGYKIFNYPIKEEEFKEGEKILNNCFKDVVKHDVLDIFNSKETQQRPSLLERFILGLGDKGIVACDGSIPHLSLFKNQFFADGKNEHYLDVSPTQSYFHKQFKTLSKNKDDFFTSIGLNDKSLKEQGYPSISAYYLSHPLPTQSKDVNLLKKLLPSELHVLLDSETLPPTIALKALKDLEDIHHGYFNHLLDKPLMFGTFNGGEYPDYSKLTFQNHGQSLYMSKVLLEPKDCPTARFAKLPLENKEVVKELIRHLNEPIGKCGPSIYRLWASLSTAEKSLRAEDAYVANVTINKELITRVIVPATIKHLKERPHGIVHGIVGINVNEVKSMLKTKAGENNLAISIASKIADACYNCYGINIKPELEYDIRMIAVTTTLPKGKGFL